MKKIALFLVLLLSPLCAIAQTANTYYTAPTVAAIKALTTRPSVIEVVDSNPGVFNWATTPCSAADDIFQITPTSGPVGCYIRMATPYAAGNAGPASAVLITNGSKVPAFSTTLPNGLAFGTPAFLTLTNATGLPNAGLLNSSITINDNNVALGSSTTVTAVASSIAPGTTAVSPNTNSKGLVYNNAGVVGVLASANSGVWSTDGSGNTTNSTTLPNGLAMGTPASLTLTNATGLPNVGLLNSSVTINENAVSLGGSITITAAASSITSGTTTATGFTNGHVVGVSSGKTTDFATSGTGTIVALTVSPAFTTPSLGAATATSLYMNNGSPASTIDAYATVQSSSYLIPGFNLNDFSIGSLSYPDSSSHSGLVVQSNKANTNTGSSSAVLFAMYAQGLRSTAFSGGGGAFVHAMYDSTNTANSGNWTGWNPYVIIDSGVVPQSVVGEEIDLFINSSSLVNKEGLRIADLSTSGTASGFSSAIRVTKGSSSAPGWADGLSFNADVVPTDANFPISAGGNLITASTSALILNAGVNLSGMQPFSTAAYIAPANSGGFWFGAAGGGGSISSTTTSNGPSLVFGSNLVSVRSGVTSLWSIDNVGEMTTSTLIAGGSKGSFGTVYGLYLSSNISSTYPTLNSGLAIGGNFSAGASEIDFWNTTTSATTSFVWYQQTGASVGTLLASLNTSGKFTAVSLQASTVASFGAGSPTLSSGEIGMTKISASGTAPGAGTAKFEWVAGTNAGSCKLISYAGTSNTPVSIVDNVGSGC